MSLQRNMSPVVERACREFQQPTNQKPTSFTAGIFSLSACNLLILYIYLHHCSLFIIPIRFLESIQLPPKESLEDVSHKWASAAAASEILPLQTSPKKTCAVKLVVLFPQACILFPLNASPACTTAAADSCCHRSAALSASSSTSSSSSTSRWDCTLPISSACCRCHLSASCEDRGSELSCRQKLGFVGGGGTAQTK